MRTPSWLVIVPLFVVVWLLATLAPGWSRSIAHATTGQRTLDSSHAVALSQDDNSSDDDEDDGDNDGSDDNDNHDSNSNDNERPTDVNIVTVPVPVSAPAPTPAAPPASPVDEASQCLANGGTLVLHGPDAGIAVKSYQDNLNVTITRVNPASQPLPPGVIVSNDIFRLSASPCGGAPYTVLPIEVNLAVSYSDALAAGRDESRFTLMRYDGTTWTTAPKLFRDPANNHVSASVTGLGVYALVQQ
jgi:hypothetical protein